MKVAAIIPAFNEYQHLTDIVRRTRHWVDEVIIVDDGSTRPLKEIVGADASLFFIRHRINLGKGAAMKTGIALAQRHGADVVVFLDADGQHLPEEIPTLLEPLREGRADLVFGVRRFHERMPLVARLGNQFLTKALKMLFKIGVSDTQSGFRALRLSVYPQLIWQSSRYSVEAEMIVNAGKNEVRFAEVPIQTIYHDAYKGSTVIDGVRIIIHLVLWKL